MKRKNVNEMVSDILSKINSPEEKLHQAIFGGELKDAVEVEVLEKVKRKSKAKAKAKVISVVDKVDSYLDFKIGSIISCNKEGEDGKFSGFFNIDSIGIEDKRYYFMLNKVTSLGKIDKRFKLIKKYVDELPNASVIKQFAKGDLVFLSHRDRIGWELDIPNVLSLNSLRKNMFFTVTNSRFELGGYIYIAGYVDPMHPNHFTKKEEI